MPLAGSATRSRLLPASSINDPVTGGFGQMCDTSVPPRPLGSELEARGPSQNKGGKAQHHVQGSGFGCHFVALETLT